MPHPKRPGRSSRLGRVLFWSVISAAFIGPGTVATAAKAGATHGTALLWALWFSVAATLILQEAAARVPLLTGLNLGQAIAQRFPRKGQQRMRWGLALAVAFGCAAYQTGNLLGAMLGLQLIWPTLSSAVLLPVASVAAWLLWLGRIRYIAQGLGLIVALMGLLFLGVAWQSPASGLDLLRDSLVPSLPQGSAWLVIALIGTTIVPYNLFLGSGLEHGQTLKQMRGGLAVAVLLGGIISVAILLVGTGVNGAFSLARVAEAMVQRTGQSSRLFFAWGLFTAGFSSATTAPLAASLTLSGLIGGDSPAWRADGRAFRLTWAVVLCVGLAFGLLQVPPVPAIILAQAINGLLLPLVAIFLYFIINDRHLMPPEGSNPPWLNGLTLLVVAIATALGLLNLARAAGSALGFEVSTAWLPWLGGLALLLTVAAATKVRPKSSPKG